MLIVCPTCATSYDVDTASLRPNGRQVRCVRCRAIWRAELSPADKLIAAAEALAPVRRAVEAMAEAAAGPPRAAPVLDEAVAEAPPVALDEAPAAPAMSEGYTPDVPADDVVAVDSPPLAPADPDAVPPPEGPAPDGAEPVVEPSAEEPLAEEPLVEEPSEDIETVAARRFHPAAKRKKRGWPLSRLQAAILALVIVDGIIVGWRTDFVRALPQTASFYAAIGMPVNLRGVVFDHLTTTTEQHEGMPILVVEGSILNNAGRMIDVPRLRFAVRNAAREEIYSWTAVPPRTALPTGEAVAFRTRLASPPPDAHDVLVRFVNRFDMVSVSR